MADITDATFQDQVVDRSRTVPVIVDLWASWCEPCRQLTPILERAVAETNGAVELAKVDIENNPGVAQAFRVQSIPAVYAMVDGQVADGFLGAQGEAAVREFVQRLGVRSHAQLVIRTIAMIPVWLLESRRKTLGVWASWPSLTRNRFAPAGQTPAPCASVICGCVQPAQARQAAAVFACQLQPRGSPT